jgi:DsbC/DsbD-like thiol-disulfide interchange protein
MEVNQKVNGVGAVAVGYTISGAESVYGSDGERLPWGFVPGPYKTKKGALVTLAVLVKINYRKYVYARLPEGDSREPLTISVELPEGARWHGEWQTPKTYEGGEPGVTVYAGEAVFTRQFYFTKVPTESVESTSQGDSIVKIRGLVRYPVCIQVPKVEACFDPQETPFDVKVIVTDN